jgi:hypothetical protein
LWSAREDRLAVAVFDGRAGELLVLDVESDNALEAFYTHMPTLKRSWRPDMAQALTQSDRKSASYRRLPRSS